MNNPFYIGQNGDVPGFDGNNVSLDGLAGQVDTGFKSIFQQDNTNRTVSNLQQMNDFAVKNGIDPNEITDNQEGFLDKAVRYLNTPIAALAGTASYLMNSQNANWGSEVQKYWQGTKGFGDLIRQESNTYYDWDTDKVKAGGAFAGGLALDVALDPTTYLSFGTSAVARIAGKTIEKATVAAKIDKRIYDAAEGAWKTAKVTEDIPLTNKAQQLMMDVEKQQFISVADQLTQEGMTRQAAEELAQTTAHRDALSLMNNMVTNQGMTQNMFDGLLKRGIERGTAEEMKAISQNLLDRGGINWYGMRLVDSQVLAETAVGKAAKNLYENFGIQGVTEAIKTPFLKAFSYGFGQMPGITDFLHKANVLKGLQVGQLSDQFAGAVAHLTDEQSQRLFETGFQSKSAVIQREAELIDKGIGQLRAINPDAAAQLDKILGTTNKLDELDKYFNKQTDLLEASTTAHHKDLNSAIEKIATKSLDKASYTTKDTAQVIADNKELSTKAAELKKAIDDKLKQQGILANTVHQTLAEAPLGITTAEQQLHGLDYVAGIMHEKVWEKQLQILSKIEKLTSILNDPAELAKYAEKQSAAMAKKALKEGAKNTHVFTPEEQIAHLVEEIKTLQNETATKIAEMTTQKSRMQKIVGDIGDARRMAKAEFKAQGIPSFDDKALDEAAQKLWNEKDGIFPKIARSMNLSDEDMFHMYVPEFKKPEATISNFVRGSGSWFKSKFGDRKEMIRTLSAFKELGGVTDMKEVAARFAVKAAEERVKTSMFKTAIQEFGTSYDDMLVQATAKEHLDSLVKSSGKVWLERTLPDGSKIGAYFPEQMKTDLEQGLFGMAPKSVFNLTAPGLKNFYNWYTQLTKSALTGLFPAFHVQNFTGNTINSMIGFGFRILDPKLNRLSIDMLRSTEHYVGFKQALMKAARGSEAELRILDAQRTMEQQLKLQTITNAAGKTISKFDLLKQIRREYPELFITGQFGMDELGFSGHVVPDFINNMTNKVAAIPYGTKASKIMKSTLDPNSAFWQTTREVGQMFEVQSKLSNIVGVWMEGGTIKQGIKMAEQNMFNYSKLTPFERTYIKNVIPFYTFQARNIAFTAKMIAEKPGVMFMHHKLLHNLSASMSDAYQSDSTYLPQWLHGSLGFHVGSVARGTHGYVTGLGFPFENAMSMFSTKPGQGVMTSTISNILGSLNPLIKVPIEQALNQDIYRGKQISELTQPDAFVSMIGGMDNVVANQFKKLIDYRTVTKPIYVNGKYIGDKQVVTANPVMLHIIRNLPTSRLQNFTGKTYQDILSSNATWNSTITGSSELLTGMRYDNINDQRVKMIEQLSQMQELGKWLSQTGYLNTYQSFSVPDYTHAQHRVVNKPK